METTALLLGGFVLAHAAWSISDIQEGELLVPLVIVESQSGQRALTRFEAETQEQAVVRGKEFVKERSKESGAWAFAREGLFPLDGVKVDVLVIDCWARGMKSPIMIVQRFMPHTKTHPFRIVGEPTVVIGGKVQDRERSKSLLSNLSDGIKSHSKVSPLWNSWKVK